MSPSSSISLDAIGATGDGVTDDSGLFQAAIDAAMRFDGVSTITTTPGKTYLIARQVYLPVVGSGLRITGGGTIRTTADYGIRAGIDFTRYTHHAIAECDAADTFVTTSAPSDLTAGDYVLVYTGNTAANSGTGIGAPDSEINLVVSVVGSQVNLAWPLCKNYRQEYFNVGEDETSGATSTGFVGDAALLGVRKIDVFADIEIDNLTIEAEGSAYFIAGDGLVDLNIHDVTADCAGGFISISPWTGEMRDCTINVQTQYGYWFSTAFGSRDVTLADCTFTADTLGYLHIHEGSSNVTVERVECSNASGVTGTAQSIVGLRGRGYDITLTDITVVNGPLAGGGAALRVDETTTGSATGFASSGTVWTSVVNESTSYTVNGVPGS